MEKKQQHNKFRILMFPWLAHGHVFPYLQLAKALSTRNFHLYLCSTPINLNSIKQDDDHHDLVNSIEFIELQLPSSPEFPPHYHTTKNVPPHLMPKLLEALGKSRSSFSTNVASLMPDLLIFDVFQPWAAAVASSLGVPAVHFATSGATVYSFMYHRLLHGEEPPFPYHEAIFQHEHEWKAIRAMGLRDKMDQGTLFPHFSLSCDIVLMRTCREIEGKYIDYLSELCNKKVIPVGPLVAQSNTEENDKQIMEWLGEKPPFSTVFISFGSENYLSKDQMEEIAKGLESCEVNFIWTLRFPPGEKVSLDETLSEGFLDRVKERGMIVQGWAPQAKILAHPSMGGFVSHCGLSSIIESIYFGVPVIGIPLKLDQPLNARLVVDTGVGIEVKRDGDGHFTGKDVADALRKTIMEKTGEDMRLSCAELSKKMKSKEDDAANEAAEELKTLCTKHRLQKRNQNVSSS
ncbi:beta-D-glucosyl crocetin beta-1,6-glucosyltransferase-like [Andrographis paniculata]|uniref:beta-D-glucosyl crocetin beta-1,6-glucosyltransferase-like n=1 Tax=Andrographis paniculata TaxID=175694 RepID=UPI0021E82E8E|nr:beta-D-glucosyl crocetin beta-1,6-glucosyltransferase-like [Andrographis paniculata]